MSTNTIIVIVVVGFLFMQYSKKDGNTSGGTPTGTAADNGGTNNPTGNSTGGLTTTNVQRVGTAAVSLIDAFTDMFRRTNN